MTVISGSRHSVFSVEWVEARLNRVTATGLKLHRLWCCAIMAPEGPERSQRVQERAMRFGVTVPNNLGLDNPQDVIDAAVRAEEMGFHSVWVSHHVLNAGYILDRIGGKPYYDAITILAYMAALTKTVRLGTSVLVLPYFNPIVLAKSLATLDVLSGGRVTAGIGVGALRLESDALGSPFARRGAYANEGIAIMKELWTQDDPSFNGRFFSFSGVKFSPKPVQTPHLPIWIGGNSDAALYRAAHMGDGWHADGLSPQDMTGRTEKLKTEVAAAGRSMSDITLSIRQSLDIVASPADDRQGPMVGTPDQILSTIEAYAALGVSEIVLGVSSRDTDRIYGVMEAFATKVMPRAS